nr:leucine-rich repeat domain-containing protein [Aphanizomenon flos-aquae]
MTTLYLSENQISDIKPLSNLTNLTSLTLRVNQISDIKPLSNLTNLTFLTLLGNPLTSKQCPLKPEYICKF